MNNELKVSFYLKREGNTERTEANPDAVFRIIGKIIIGNSIAQFGLKLKIEERLWSVKSGRAIGKSRAAVLQRHDGFVTLDDRAGPDALAGTAILFAADDILRDVDQTAPTPTKIRQG